MTLSKILAASAAAAALVASAGGAQAASIVNGSFEVGSNDAGLGGFSTLNGGSTAITGWTVTGHSVDWINGYWQASNGTHSVDLNGLGVGGVSQTIATTPGQTYKLTFDMSGNPDHGTNVFSMLVSAGNASQGFNYNGGSNNHSNMNYQSDSLTFTATAPTTTINFGSTNLDNCCWGPALDNVSISDVTGGVPEPATWAMTILGFGLIGTSLRRRKAAIATAA